MATVTSTKSGRHTTHGPQRPHHRGSRPRMQRLLTARAQRSTTGGGSVGRPVRRATAHVGVTMGQVATATNSDVMTSVTSGTTSKAQRYGSAPCASDGKSDLSLVVTKKTSCLV
eukprot:2128906-Prymnesium_polylepis.1